MGKDLSDEERLKRRQLKVRVTLEVAGNPKEYVEKAIQLLCDEVEKQGHTIIKEEVFEAEKKEGSEFFIAFAELDIWIQNMDKLIGFAFDFLPSSVEIIQPTEYSGKVSDLNGMLNDLVIRLHDADMKIKNANASLTNKDAGMVTLVRNMAAYLVAEKPYTAKDISTIIGIKPEEVEKCLKLAVEQGKIGKSGQKYTSVEKKKQKK